MKYTKRVALALLCFTPKGYANNVYSHTFFSAIPQYKLITNLTTNTLPDQAHQEGRVLKKRTMQLAIFGGRSNDTSGLRDYFLYDGKLNLQVMESPSQEGGTGNNVVGNDQDLIAGDFNIQTVNASSASSIAINPKQTVSGAALTLRAPIGQKLWVTAEFPVVHVRNNLDFTETFTVFPLPAANPGAVGFYNPLTGNVSAPIATMTQAFQQNGMLYGRINGVQHTTQLAEINVKAGYDAIDRTDMYMSIYGGVSIPTGNKPKGLYMFEAIGGNNGHTGLSGGLFQQLMVHEFKGCNMWLNWSMEAEYLLHNIQVRSFDLKDRPWSRYMQVYKNESDRVSTIPNVNGLTTWGINYFTQKLNVKPGANATFNMNINLYGETWNGSLGLNTFVRSAESISLANPWELGPQLAMPNSSYPVPQQGPNNTTPLRTIGVLTNTAATFDNTYYVQESDLDLNSAAHPTVRATTGYGTLGYYRKTKHPQYFEFGSSYEWGTQNTALKRWTVWTKVQITF